MKHFLNTLSIKSQLLLITLLLALPSITIIIYTGLHDRSQAIADTYRINQLITDQIVTRQQQLAADAEHLLRSLAEMPELHRNNPAELQRELVKTIKRHKDFTNILVIDRSGVVVAAAIMPPANTNLKDRRYFKNALATGNLATGEYIISKSLHTPIFNFAYPYRTPSGVIAGVIVLSYNLETYDRVLNLMALHRSINFMLLDHNGIIMHRTRKSKQWVGSPYSDAGLQQMLAGPDTQSYRGVTILGKDSFITCRKIRLKEESKPYMYVRIAMPAAEALAENTRTMTWNLTFLLIGTTIAFVLAWLAGNRFIIRPIERLKDAVRDHANGERQVKFDEAQVSKELIHLARSFEDLIIKLNEREQHLRENVDQLHSITNSTRDAILMMDASGAVTFWNPAATLIFGYQTDEALGRNLHALLVPERYLADHHAALPEFVRSGQGEFIGKTVELAARRKDGSEITVALSLSSVQLHGIWHGVGILRDITAEKLQQHELDEARKTAETASLAKGQFLANMSHEIRTPLNGVIGMSQLLRYTTLCSEQEEYLGYLEQSANNLLALLNDILDLSKIEAGKMELEQTVFNLKNCLDTTVATLQFILLQKHLRLEISLPDDLPELLIGDPLRFRQILLNLLGNAVKFTSSGTVGITVSILNRHDATIDLLIEVSDTGIGMTQETIGRIFNIFEQSDNSNTRKFGGSGLGLAICLRLTALMGGCIRVESIPDQGSSFFVELPFGVDRQIALKRQSAAPQSPQQPPVQLHILIAEDNRLNADTLLAMLRRLGHTASVAYNGQDAIDLLRKETFNCILMDISMPVMDGRTATSIIREQEYTVGGHIPIIALTAHALQGDRESFLAAGFDEYISKPVTMQILTDELAQIGEYS
jgi:PAS domain S-box-containing protein